MSLHLQTSLYILGFVGMAVLIGLGVHAYPTFTLTVVAIFLFVAFYNLVYSFLKIERSIDELNRDK